MKWIRFAVIAFAVVCGVAAICFVLSSDKALVTHPKGIIAQGELDLLARNLLLMLIVVIPTFILLFTVAWKYRAQNKKATYDPERSHGKFGGWMLWIVPAVIVAVMAYGTWFATHELDPYRPIDSKIPPLTIEVVALDWKWLFIYPEQQIATVNFVQFPAKRPIHFKHAADDSPMNSFWIPSLSGQIYSMAGMVTPLHVMADEPGEYAGRAAEINGEGFADMTFIAKSTTESDFENWVAEVKQSPLALTGAAYSELLKKTKNHPIALYSYVEKDLFHNIVMKYMYMP